MKLSTQLINLHIDFPKIAVALGAFDGVHIGHQKIISKAVNLAQSIRGTSVVFSFSNHPLSVIDPKRCPPQIITSDYKIELIKNMGVDVYLTIPFTPSLLKIPPAEFIAMLHENMHPEYIVVGPNYSFGYKGAGTPEMLKEAGRQYRFNVEIQEAVYMDGLLVSSTAIRQMVASGEIRPAAKLLGRLFRIEGKVIPGDSRGRLIGYPTANLAACETFVIPRNGVYAVYVYIENNPRKYNGIVNIGFNPTFKGENRQIEVHILDFKGDLYGKKLAIDFLEHIRDEIAFDDTSKLIKQISCDIHIAQKYY